MSQHVGRHRSQSFSAFGELADLAARSARPAAKASAVAVASGGIVASFAVPANAHPLAAGPAASAALAAKPVAAPALAAPAAAAPAAAAPAVKVPASAALMALAAPQASPAAARPLVAAAVAAPAKKGDVNPVDTLGVLGFTAKKAAPSATISVERIAPLVTATAVAAGGTASRSASRTGTSAGSTAQAPAVKIPAPTAGIAAIAASLLGIPYVYGGTSTGGFDCSGYTQYVYRMAGKSIPRTAEAQRAASTKVSNPVPGDLVFFGYPAFHAAIYAGPGKIYHASRPGTLTSLSNFLSYGTVTYGRF